MNGPIALTAALHAIRLDKPHDQIAEETKISPDQLWKYRQGARTPRVDEWERIIRSVAEVSTHHATLIARAYIPTELFALTPKDLKPSSLAREIMESGAAAGHLQDVFLDASADGVIDAQDLDDCEAAYQQMVQQAQEGLARIEMERKSREGE